MNKKLYSIFLLAAVSLFSLPIHSAPKRAQTSRPVTNNDNNTRRIPLPYSLVTNPLVYIRKYSQSKWKKYSRPLKSISLAAVSAGIYTIQKYYGARIHDCLNIETPTGQGINNIFGLTTLGTGLYSIWSVSKAYFSSSKNPSSPKKDDSPHPNLSPRDRDSAPSFQLLREEDEPQDIIRPENESTPLPAPRQDQKRNQKRRSSIERKKNAERQHVARHRPQTPKALGHNH